MRKQCLKLITMSVTFDQISGNVAAVRRDIAMACSRAGRDPQGVRLIAVTKNQQPDVMPMLVAAGVHDFGENRLEHHEAMSEAARASGIAVRFHAMGRIQSRQLPKLARISDVLHSLSELDHVPRLARACAERTRLPVFLQVNTSGETAKAGCTTDELPALLQTVRAQSQLEVVGLMTMAEEGVATDLIRATFARLRMLAIEHGIPRLSMGMSQDFTIAIEEGATDIRIGTRLFVAAP